MKKNILLLTIALLPIAALSAEPSAFGATTDNRSNTYNNSYGNSITVSEKGNTHINQRTPTIQESVGTVKAELSNVSEQYEGMRSVLDSYATKIAKQDEKIRQLEEEIRKLKDSGGAGGGDVKKLQEYVEESRAIQTENQEKIKVVVGELGSLIDSINKNYVPKDKFDQLASEVRGGKKTTAEATKKETPAQSAKDSNISPKELASKDSATLLKEADELFDKKSFSEAGVIYSELLKRNYKPAKVNFNLGEIAFNQKAYTSAIEHYKTSISLFDKASYTPTLLYHTGASFEKLGKTKEAQGFYKALKDSYPNSPEAKKVK